MLIKDDALTQQQHFAFDSSESAPSFVSRESKDQTEGKTANNSNNMDNTPIPKMTMEQTTEMSEGAGCEQYIPLEDPALGPAVQHLQALLVSSPPPVQPAMLTGHKNDVAAILLGPVESSFKSKPSSNTNAFYGANIDDQSNQCTQVQIDTQPKLVETAVSVLEQSTPTESQQPSTVAVTSVLQQELLQSETVTVLGQQANYTVNTVDIMVPDGTQLQTENDSTQEQTINNDPLAAPIDNFIESISVPILQPLLQRDNPSPGSHLASTSNIVRHNSPPPSSAQRKSTRLAQKAVTNMGKNAIKIAQDLLISKLGDLSGEENRQISEENNQNSADLDFYTQHFEKPIDKTKMEAFKVLIEEDAKKEKKGSFQKKATVAPGLEA